eukprot:GHVT01068297.1.p1 GENE.GHVT01068297.1~~GHVT01068297.1.p1  ORF type:complete len:719 (+),score=100.11 GHVT01068297.1:3391-5547(+)
MGLDSATSSATPSSPSSSSSSSFVSLSDAAARPHLLAQGIPLAPPSPSSASSSSSSPPPFRPPSSFVLFAEASTLLGKQSESSFKGYLTPSLASDGSVSFVDNVTVGPSSSLPKRAASPSGHSFASTTKWPPPSVSSSSVGSSVVRLPSRVLATTKRLPLGSKNSLSADSLGHRYGRHPAPPIPNNRKTSKMLAAAVPEPGSATAATAPGVAIGAVAAPGAAGKVGVIGPISTTQVLPSVSQLAHAGAHGSHVFPRHSSHLPPVVSSWKLTTHQLSSSPPAMIKLMGNNSRKAANLSKTYSSYNASQSASAVNDPRIAGDYSTMGSSVSSGVVSGVATPPTASDSKATKNQLNVDATAVLIPTHVIGKPKVNVQQEASNLPLAKRHSTAHAHDSTSRVDNSPISTTVGVAAGVTTAKAVLPPVVDSKVTAMVKARSPCLRISNRHECTATDGCFFDLDYGGVCFTDCSKKPRKEDCLQLPECRFEHIAPHETCVNEGYRTLGLNAQSFGGILRSCAHFSTEEMCTFMDETWRSRGANPGDSSHHCRWFSAPGLPESNTYAQSTTADVQATDREGGVDATAAGIVAGAGASKSSSFIDASGGRAQSGDAGQRHVCANIKEFPNAERLLLANYIAEKTSLLEKMKEQGVGLDQICMPPIIQHGTIAPAKEIYRTGDSVTMTCDSGFVATWREITCGPEGHFIPTAYCFSKLMINDSGTCN